MILSNIEYWLLMSHEVLYASPLFLAFFNSFFSSSFSTLKLPSCNIQLELLALLLLVVVCWLPIKISNFLHHSVHFCLRSSGNERRTFKCRSLLMEALLVVYRNSQPRHSISSPAKEIN